MSKSCFLFFLPLMLFLFACSNQPKSETKPPIETVQQPPIVGGDSDAHGCKGSAGYTWSVVKNECIRIFESGIRLNPKSQGSDRTMSAFIVFKSDMDDAQAELFFPGQPESILLTKEKKESAGIWKNDTYKLSQWKGMYTLENKKKTLLYQGAAVQ